MEFGVRVPRKRLRVKLEEHYPCSLQFYNEPPQGEVSIKEFDEMAIERLKVLRSIERWNLSGHIKSTEDWMNKLFDDFTKNKYFIAAADKLSESRKDELKEVRRKDHISHFILRLAYCRTEDLRRWFIALETDLFRARFMRATYNGTDLKPFLDANDLKFMVISEDEMNSEATNLADGTYNIQGVDQLEGKIFYKVPFIEALELVRTRKVFLKGGYAYVPSSDLVTLVCNVFRMKLSCALANTSRALPQLDDDERLVAMLKDFDKRFTGEHTKKATNTTQISPEMINQLSNKSFPLCMRQLQDNLRINGHLKHGGRMQYGLFLKHAGLTLEDALKFWKSHFVKNMDSDKFDKQYAYSIRHNYGKEGKRVNYSAYSCMKIITTSVGPGDAHGCPFRHTDPAALKQKLSAYRVPQQAITEICELVSKSHYQIACQRYFEATHNTFLESGVSHPNSYFEESMALLHGTKEANRGNKNSLKLQKSVVYSQSQDNSTPVEDKTQINDVTADDSIFDDIDMSFMDESVPL